MLLARMRGSQSESRDSVDPAWHREGIGEALLRADLASADRDGFSCSLEAPTADVARYHPRRGFREVAETDVPKSGVHVWLMRGESRPS